MIEPNYINPNEARKGCVYLLHNGVYVIFGDDVNVISYWGYWGDDRMRNDGVRSIEDVERIVGDGHRLWGPVYLPNRYFNSEDWPKCSGGFDKEEIDGDTLDFIESIGRDTDKEPIDEDVLGFLKNMCKIK